MLWIDGVPTIILFIAFVLVVVIPAVLILHLFRQLNLKPIKCEEHNVIISILIGIMSVFFGVLLSFLIVTASTIFNQAYISNAKEGQVSYILYELLYNMPRTQKARRTIIEYLEYVINIEYPAITKGSIPPGGQKIIERLQREIYSYVPTTTQEEVLFNRTIVVMNLLLDLRIDRINTAQSSLNPLLLWITILDAILILLMTCVLNCYRIFHYVVVVIVSIYIGSGLFTVLALSNPFQGNTKITAAPFEEALQEIKDNYDL